MDRSLGSDGSLRVLMVAEQAAEGSDPGSWGAQSIDGMQVGIDSLSGGEVDERLEETDLLVAVGEAALLAAVRARVELPILPVSGPDGVESVSGAEVEKALDGVLDGNYTIDPVPSLSVRADGAGYRGLMDVMAVTSEAAKISEYQVSRVVDGDEQVLDRIRADGMLAAAPAGTPGYGTAAGGPILGPDLRAVSVVPVGPFRIEQPHWVLKLPIRIRVVREEVPVALLVDDQEVGSMAAGAAVTVDWGSPVRILRTPQSRSGVVAAGDDGTE